MNLSTKMIITLTVITVLSGGVLSIWDGYTSPKVDAHRLNELKSAIADVIPAYDRYDTLKGNQMDLFIGRKKGSEKPVGIAFRAVGSGFQGKVSIMVGVTPDFSKLTGIKVLEQIETPGLGTKIVEDPSNKADIYWFPKQFIGRNITKDITYVKNAKPSTDSEIQAISGATISSAAVVRILNTDIKKAKQIYQNR